MAQAFIESSRKRFPNADICFLLRLGFLESEARREFFQQMGVPDLYILPNRPSFTGQGTDASTYAWFLWSEQPAKIGRVQILKYTPRAERKKARDQNWQAADLPSNDPESGFGVAAAAARRSLEAP
jgi:hypothetical protein